jgi:hypothetical protein
LWALRGSPCISTTLSSFNATGGTFSVMEK